MSSNRQTQRERILALLRAADGGWVGLPAILDLRIALYTTRILELRRAGYDIENRTQTVDGIRHSWYRLNFQRVICTEPRQITDRKQTTSENESTYMRRRREEQAAAMPLFEVLS